MGAGGRHRGRRGGRVVVKITNKNNPELAARMAGITHCGIIMGLVLIFPGIALTAVGAGLGTFHLYPGAALLGISFLATVTSLLLCLFVVKPSCCYPHDPVVGTSVGGRLVTSVAPGVVTINQPFNANAAMVVGASQPVNSQYNTNYGNFHAQPVAPPQYSTGTVPPPSYEQSTMYPPPDPKAMYLPPPPAAY